MARAGRGPADVAERLAQRRDKAQSGRARDDTGATWRRETFVLEREAARDTAREWFRRFPKAAYMTEVESWRDLGDGRIEFTMRRLPSAD